MKSQRPNSQEEGGRNYVFEDQQPLLIAVLRKIFRIKTTAEKIATQEGKYIARAFTNTDPGGKRTHTECGGKLYRLLDKDIEGNYTIPKGVVCGTCRKYGSERDFKYPLQAE